MNKKIVHDALILFAFTIVLGLLLGVVYGVTKPSIDKVNEEKTQNAYKQVFTDADHFTDYADFDADAAQALLDENGYSDEIETVVAAQDASENTLGYVFTVTAKDGSQRRSAEINVRQTWFCDKKSDFPEQGAGYESGHFVDAFSDKPQGQLDLLTGDDGDFPF